MTTRSTTRVPPGLVAGFILFVLVLAYLLAASLLRPDVVEFEPSPAGARPERRSATPDTVTVDAADVRSWQFVDLDRAELLSPPDTAGWDLGFRRFHVITSGAVADAGPVPFDRLPEAPQRGYRITSFAADTVNPATARWYRYSFLTHLLQPEPRLYVVRTTGGRYAKLEFLSYYCPGTRPGCVTFRYLLASPGGRAFP